jgi:hypothetical protein
MNSRWLTALVVFVAISGVAEEAHEHEQEDGIEHHHGHVHGGPLFKGETTVAVGLTIGGTVLVVLTFLGIIWKPIDAAFRRSRFRSRWEKRATRFGFAAITTVLAALVMGAVTYFGINQDHHKHSQGELTPLHGGQVTKVDRFALEMVARRTGELRLYLTTLEGAAPTGWDVKGDVIMPQRVIGVSEGSATNLVLPIKVNYDASYFGAYTMPFAVRDLPVHLALKIKDQSMEADFQLRVQD